MRDGRLMNRVLIIEDEDAIAELERDYLTLADYDVVVEGDGIAGKKLALSGEFDIVLLDVMLPGEDGFSIVKELRQESDIPVIMISARKDDIDKIRGLGLGADDYITKPFSPSELVARVKAHIDRYVRLTGRDEVDDGIIEVRGMRIDTGSHEVYIGADKKNLTTREYDLLMYLVERPNVTVSKDELYSHVWNEEAIGDVGTVAVHVNRLREKLEQDPTQPVYLETVWGMGYRFKA